jgi:glycosyltransferase involved in cell wall biosynthesis
VKIIVLIPSFQPDHRLVELVEALAGRPGVAICVVDDGSGPEFGHIFRSVEAIGAELVAHQFNLGKGAALKTGLAEIQARYPGVSVVTADSDGQHSLDDIHAVADRLEESKTPSLVLGAREFDSETPWKSRVGNRMSSYLFLALWGKKLRDTQTGLRGISSELIENQLLVPGERFEYESNVLIDAIRSGIPATYLDSTNSHSHFRPVVDSLIILGVLFKQLAKFVGSSALSALVDIGAFALILALVFSGVSDPFALFTSAAAARLLSLSVNFTINYKVVFESRRNPKFALISYLALAIFVFLASTLSAIALTTIFHWRALEAKIFTDVALFFLSFLIQRSVTFTKVSTTFKSKLRFK